MLNVSSPLPAKVFPHTARWLGVALVALAAGCSASSTSSTSSTGGQAPDEVSASVRSAFGARGGSNDDGRGDEDNGGGSGGSGTCDRASRGETAIVGQVRIDDYLGTRDGRNGAHEIAYGTIVSTSFLSDPSAVDTPQVKLAMNVATQTDPAGLPSEVPLTVGQIIELKGEYIPAARANGSGGNRGVIHFTHTPCGYVTIDGQTYR